MHLIFAVHTGKASLVTVAGRLIDMAEAEGFTCSMLDPNGVVKPSEDAAIVAVGGDGNFIRTAQIEIGRASCRERVFRAV